MSLPENTRRRLVSGAVMLATLMQTLDSTIANVALPHMQGNLNASQDQIAWVVTSYVIAGAIGLTLTGFFAERYGRRRMLIFGVGGFTLASVLCSSAQSINEIVLFRLLQGFSGAYILPLAQAEMLNLYPSERHTQILATWSMGVMIGPILGPTAGGFLTDLYNWRWVFLINLPIGLLTLAGIVFLARETERAPGRDFDAMGFGFLATALAAFQLMLDRGETKDWFGSSEIVIEAILAVVAFYLFLVHILTVHKPFIRMALFRNRNYVLGLVLMFFNGAVPVSTMVLLPSMLQNIMGYTAQDAGVMMAPRGVGSIISLWIVVRGLRLFGARAMLVMGLSCVVATLVVMSGFTTDTRESLILTSGFVQGMGMGLVYMPLNDLIFGTMEQRFLTEAAAFSMLVRNIGSSIGISILVTLLSHNSQIVRSDLATYINPFSRPLQQLATQTPLANTPTALALINGEIDRQAAMAAYIDDFHLMMLVSCAMIPLIFFFRMVPRKPQVDNAASAMEV